MPRPCRLAASSVLALWLLATPGHAGTPTTTLCQVATTAQWFDALGWPVLHDAPYVEISLGSSPSIPEAERLKIRAFLLAEDEKNLTIFCDGTSVTRGGESSTGEGWALQMQRIPKAPQDGSYQNLLLPYRKLALSDAVDAVLASWQHPAIPPNPDAVYLRERRAACTALFVLARCCAQQGRADLAGRLDAELTRPEAALPTDDTGQIPTFLAAIEEELGAHRFSEVTNAYRDPVTPRADSLRDFERFAHDFSLSPARDAALQTAVRLRPMVAEDAAHQDWENLLRRCLMPKRSPIWSTACAIRPASNA